MRYFQTARNETSSLLYTLHGIQSNLATYPCSKIHKILTHNPVRLTNCPCSLCTASADRKLLVPCFYQTCIPDFWFRPGQSSVCSSIFCFWSIEELRQEFLRPNKLGIKINEKNFFCEGGRLFMLEIAKCYSDETNIRWISLMEKSFFI